MPEGREWYYTELPKGVYRATLRQHHWTAAADAGSSSPRTTIWFSRRRSRSSAATEPSTASISRRSRVLIHGAACGPHKDAQHWATHQTLGDHHD
jgi:hypothetical protein